MQPLKETLTSRAHFKQCARDMKQAYSSLDEDAFFRFMVRDLDQLELKQRITRAVEACGQFLPSDFPQALNILYRFAENKDIQFFYLFLSEFVATYGLDDYDRSIQALHDFTPLFSSEFAIRPFIQRHPQKTLKHMLRWTSSTNVHVRRLASEGSRPRLPWGMQLKAVIADPTLTWPILDALKADPEKYVQKSVANHINDISKDHPDWVVRQFDPRVRIPPSTAWIIKHGLRTLIKKGDKGALALFGADAKPEVKVSCLKWTKRVCLGERFLFSFRCASTTKTTQHLIVDFKIIFRGKQGQPREKIFKLKQISLAAGECVDLKQGYDFKNLSTRKHYPGQHGFEILMNGEVMVSKNFVVEAIKKTV